MFLSIFAWFSAFMNFVQNKFQLHWPMLFRLPMNIREISYLKQGSHLAHWCSRGLAHSRNGNLLLQCILPFSSEKFLLFVLCYSRMFMSYFSLFTRSMFNVIFTIRLIKNKFFFVLFLFYVLPLAVYVWVILFQKLILVIDDVCFF